MSGNKVQFSTCECRTTEKMPSIDVHYLKTPMVNTNRSRKYKPGSPLFLKRTGESPFVAVAKKLTQECSNMSGFSTNNYGFDSPLKLSFTRKYDTNKHRKLILKRDVSTNTTTMVTNETIATTILTTYAPTGSSATTDRPTPITVQNQFSEISAFKDFARSAENPESGGEGATNETCDREVPCNMGDTLEEILQAVDEIAHEKSAKTAHEDFPCDVNGSWVTEAGGVRLDILVGNNSQLHIAQYETVPLKTHPGFLCNDTWTLNGTLPLSNSGIIMITGVNTHDKRVATFVGECKVCKHKETIAGHWLYVRQARDCSDEKNSYQILSDLWIRESLHTMRKQRLEMLRPGATQVTAGKQASTLAPSTTIGGTTAKTTRSTAAAATTASGVTTAAGATTATGATTVAGATAAGDTTTAVGATNNQTTPATVIAVAAATTIQSTEATVIAVAAPK